MLTEKLKDKPRNWAGLIIDMQEDFLREIPPKKKISIIEAQLEMISNLSRKSIPLVILEYEPDFCGPTIYRLKQQINKSQWFRYIEKYNDNGFNDTSLDKILKDNKIESLCIMGVYASDCVRATADNALKLNYKICTAKQLIGNSDGLIPPQTKQWYKENGIYKRDYRKLFDIIKNSE